MNTKLKAQLISILLGAFGSALSAAVTYLAGAGGESLAVTPVDGSVGAAVAWARTALLA